MQFFCCSFNNNTQLSYTFITNILTIHLLLQLSGMFQYRVNKMHHVICFSSMHQTAEFRRRRTAARNGMR